MISLNLVGHYHFSDNVLNGIELMFFAFISFILVSTLLFYYDKISKRNLTESEIQTETKTSRLPKLFVYLSFIIPFIILSLDFFNFGNLFTSFDAIMLCFLVTLILYFNIVPEIKKVIKKPKLDNPIYQSKDVLLQSNSLETNFIIAEKTTSTWVKGFVFILIFLVVVTPLYQLLGVEYFI